MMNRVFELKNNLCELDRLKAEVNKLGKAINASEDGYTVLVYPGTYQEEVNFGAIKI